MEQPPSIKSSALYNTNIRPYLKSSRPRYLAPIPPRENFGTVDTAKIVGFEVAFPARAEDFEIPSEQLYPCFKSVRRSLEIGSALLHALQIRFWHTASFEEDARPGERYLRGPDRHLFWAKRLFDRLCVQTPEIARSEVVVWPRDDQYFFDKLRIYAWTKTVLFSGSDVGSGLLGLGEEAFWNSYHRRELLHLLRDRWIEIPVEIREKIEERILIGRLVEDESGSDESVRHKASVSASVLGWLRNNGCALSQQTVSRLPSIQAANPDWSPTWELGADASFDGRTDFVSVKSDPAKITDAPISKVIEAAEEHSTRPFMEFTEYRPFSGLVQEKPSRALAALAYEARRGNFPTRYWQIALSEWPEGVPNRLQWLFGERLANLPSTALNGLSYYAPAWLRKYLPELEKRNREAALAIWDRVLDGLVSGEEGLRSGIGDTIRAGKPQNRSRRTFGHAINGPIGTMAEVLFKILDDQKLGARSGLPPEIKVRLERILKAPGEGADHAISETTIRLNWLFYLDPDWVMQRLIPMFDLARNEAEPAWNAFLHNDKLGPPELFALLKPNFLKLFKIIKGWHWDDQPISRLHEFLVIACYWNKDSHRYVDFSEARLALQHSSDDGRSHAISFLSRVITEQKVWKSFGKPFIQNAWPKEARYQTASSARQFSSIAEDSADDFPDVVRTIAPLLVPAKQIDVLIYRASEEPEGDQTTANLPEKFPSDMLTLLDRLVPDEPELAPYGLGSIVNKLAEVSSGLRQDPRWRRLNRIAHSR